MSQFSFSEGRKQLQHLASRLRVLAHTWAGDARGDFVLPLVRAHVLGCAPLIVRSPAAGKSWLLYHSVRTHVSKYAAEFSG